MMPIKRILIVIISMALMLAAAAQTFQQRGVVRLITNSTTSPITPVAGVKVAVGNSLSSVTGANGTFTVSVTNPFQVTGVASSEEYVLAHPTKGKKYYHSSNDLDVVVTTKAQQVTDYKRLYSDLKKKYRKQSDELNALREEYRDQLDELSETDVEYARVKAQLDSVQLLYTDYINNEEKINEEIKRISEELSITDYQTLDSIERKVYELKCKGEWKNISDLMYIVMHGNAQSYLNEKLANKERAIAVRQAAEEQETAADRDLATAIGFIKESIEAFKMQHLNDSVSHYYRILTDAVPDNWDYLNQAGNFEAIYMADYIRALNYHQRSLASSPDDTSLAISYENIGLVYSDKEEHDTALDYYKKALQTFLCIYGENHVYVASCYKSIGSVYRSKGDYTIALEYLGKSLDIFLGIYDEDNNPSKSCTNEPDNTYKVHENSSDPQINTIDPASLKLFIRELNISLAVLKNDSKTASTLLEIANAYMGQSKFPEALELYEKALNIYLKDYGKYDHNVANCYNNIGVWYESQGDYNTALIQYEKSLEIGLVIYGENHPNVGTFYNNIADIYKTLGNYSSALEHYENSLRIRTAFYGENHPDVASCFFNIGYAYDLKEDYVNALEYYEKALKIEATIYGENHYNVASCLFNMGCANNSKGDYANALEYFEKALKIRIAIYGENHPDVASCLFNIGDVYNSKDDYTRALEYYEKALKIRTAIYGENHPYVASCLFNMGHMYFYRDDLSAALEHFEAAQKIYLTIYDERHPIVTACYSFIGLVYTGQKDYEPALEYLEKALELKLLIYGENGEGIENLKELIEDIKAQMQEQ